jgi:hypothetical protein
MNNNSTRYPGVTANHDHAIFEIGDNVYNGNHDIYYRGRKPHERDSYFNHRIRERNVINVLEVRENQMLQETRGNCLLFSNSLSLLWYHPRSFHGGRRGTLNQFNNLLLDMEDEFALYNYLEQNNIPFVH